MPVPSPRNPILPARGNYADLLANATSLSDGEICYAIDQDTIYMKEGSSLVPVGGGGGGAVDSVNGQTGVVVLDADDIDDTSTVNKFATAAQLSLADSAIQPGDNISTLTNNSGYITGITSEPLGDLSDVSTAGATNGQFLQYNGSSWVPGAASGAPVDSVNGQTGVVVLDADDISDAATTNKFTNAADISKLAGIEAGATADQTSAEIKVAYEANADTNAFTDAEQTKLAGIAAGAEVNVNADWNAISGDAQILNKPTLGTAAAADTSDFATAAQGATADSAIQPGTVNPVFFADQASFPDATTNHGAIAHSHADGAMFFAHGGAWTEMANSSDIPAAFDGGTVNSSINSPEETITAGAWDLATGNFWTAGAITVPNPTNATAGMSGLIRLTAAPTGWGTNIKHPGGSAESISSFPAVVAFYVESGTSILLSKATQGIA